MLLRLNLTQERPTANTAGHLSALSNWHLSLYKSCLAHVVAGDRELEQADVALLVAHRQQPRRRGELWTEK